MVMVRTAFTSVNPVVAASGLQPLEFLRQEADHRHLDGGERSGPLASIERLADATIGRARLHDLLREVLERTRDVFGASRLSPFAGWAAFA